MNISLKQADKLFEAFEQELTSIDESHSSSLLVFDAAFVAKARNSLVYELELIAKYSDPSRGRGFIDRSVVLTGDQLSLTPADCAHIAKHLVLRLLGVKL